MLVADPGLGKTGTTLLALDLLKLLGSNYFPALVIAPKRVADVVWTGERDKWHSFAGLSVQRITGTASERSATLARLSADIYVINYELVPWLASIFPGATWPFKIVIADESSKLKGFRLHGGTVRAQALSSIAKFTERWWNLTGTPTPNGLQDLWGQMWFIDFGERLKRSYTAFSEAYLIEDRYTRRISLQHRADETIHAKVADRLIAFRAEDWLDILKPQIIPVPFALPSTALAAYADMEKDFFLEIDEAQISAGTAMVKTTKLLQLCGGSIYDHDEAPHHVHDARLEALEDVLEQIAPAPLLVAYWWRTDPPRILARLEKLGIKARIYQGKKDEADWNAGKIRVLLLQQQSAHGLNLHVPCRDVMFYTYTWNAELWEQMIERVGPARQAQAGKKCVVRVWYALASQTMEQSVVDSNLRKISVQDALKSARARRIDNA